MQTPASPLYSDAGLDYPSSPHRRGTNKIDYSKFKTKMCRNYLLGIPCPFEDRCAFSHGPRVTDGHAAAVARVATPGSAKQRRYVRSEDARTEDFGLESDLAAGETVSESNSDTYASLPPPPSYDVAVQEEMTVAPEAYAPPAYPTRYRYDPYSFSGVVYEA